MEENSKVHLLPLLLSIVIGVTLWFLPRPEALNADGWHLFAVFIAVIVGIIFKPIPMGGVAFLGMTVLALTRVLTFDQIFHALGGSIVWLVMCAFFVAKGFLASGLARRIAYRMMALLGSRTIGLSYGMIACDFILAPAIPSDTARAGGVIYPILKGLAKSYGSHPHDPSSRKMGSFLTVVAYHAAIITSAMFMTAMATNPLLAQLMGELGHPISWGMWALACVVPGLISLSVIPFLLYWLYPPEIRKTPTAVNLAYEKLREMGPISLKEWITAGTFILLLLLWIFGGKLGISSTIAAMTGVSILLVTGVIPWKQLIHEHDAWETLIWFSALIMMATFLSELGVSGWFGEVMLGGVSNWKWQTAFPVIALVYFFSHYFFAGNTSQVSALYVSFALIAFKVGTPPMLALLTLNVSSSLYASLTHYGTSSGPLFFGAGYVNVRTWWKLGLAVAIVNIIIWGAIGTFWWKILGLW